MFNADPYNRTSLEVRILSTLNDLGHAIVLRDLVNRINPDQNEAIVCTVFDFKGEGLVTIRDIDDGQLVNITPQGRSLLQAIYSGRTCD